MAVTTKVLEKRVEGDKTIMKIKVTGLTFMSDWFSLLEQRVRTRALVETGAITEGVLKRAIDNKDFRAINPFKNRVTLEKGDTLREGITYSVIYRVEVDNA